jgi:hypothetical protein
MSLSRATATCEHGADMFPDEENFRLIQQTIGDALRRAAEGEDDEHLPHEIVLLLNKLASAEISRQLAFEDARDSEVDASPSEHD